MACGTSLAWGAARAAGESAAADPAQAGFIGREVAGRYRILAKLGEGGMGAVYRAEQISLKRIVALKVLRPELSVEQDMVRRFNAEAELAAKLSHPNTVTLYDFGQDADGSLFIAMEYLEGRSLRDVLSREGALAQGRALAICEQLCASLSDAHAHGIVHRDLKPDNVMLVQRGRQSDVVRVLDFGIAKLRDEQGDVTAMPMTRAGDLIGTPQYMAPEQIRGERVDPRTDVYALGAMLYEMVTGRLPFEAPTLMAILSRHLTEMPAPPRERRPDLRIAPGLSQLITDALNKDPAHRPPTMDAFADRLSRLVVEVGPATGAALAGTGKGFPRAPALAESPPPGVPLLRTPLPGSIPPVAHGGVPSPVHAVQSQPPPLPAHSPSHPGYAAPAPYPSPPYASPVPQPYVSPVPGPPGPSGAMPGAMPVATPGAHHPAHQPAPGRRGLWVAMGAIAAAAVGGVVVFLVARDPKGTPSPGSPGADTPSLPVPAPAPGPNDPVGTDFSVQPERSLYGDDGSDDDDDSEPGTPVPSPSPSGLGASLPPGAAVWEGGWWKDPTGTLELDIPKGFSVGASGGTAAGGSTMFAGDCGGTPCIIYAVCAPTYGMPINDDAIEQMMEQMQEQMPMGSRSAQMAPVRVNGHEHQGMVMDSGPDGMRGQMVVFRGSGALGILFVQAPRATFDDTAAFRQSLFEKRVRVR